MTRFERNPDRDEREIEYIRRKCISAKYPEVDVDKMDDLLTHSELFKSLRSYSITDLWQVNNKLMIGLAYVSNEHNVIYETQLMAILQDHLRPAQINELQYAEYEPIDNCKVIRMPKKATLADFEKVLALLANN